MRENQTTSDLRKLTVLVTSLALGMQERLNEFLFKLIYQAEEYIILPQNVCVPHFLYGL